MLEALMAHGPDGHSQLPNCANACHHPIALGHRLLRITAEDAFESQPLASISNLILVADARIDNRDALAALLDIPGNTLGTTPDSAFILAAWQRWGPECLQHLVGSFAFALWDPRAQQLFLARDHAGDRPIYYAAGSGFFAFATTARALRACPGISSELDTRQLVRDLMGLPPDPTCSRFRDICALAAGHSLLITASKPNPTQHRYWKVFSLAPIRFARDPEYVEAFLEIFEEAVRCRLRSTGALATELSAGLDSAAVAATAARLLASTGAPLLAYTAVPCPGFSGIVPRGFIADEGPYAAEVAALYPNLQHHRVDSTASNMLDELARIFSLLDIPHAAALNQVWSSLIFDRAAAAGVKVMLAGSLGNFTVSYSGADILRPLYRSRRYLTAARMAWRLRSIGLSSGRNAASLTLFAHLPWALRRLIDPLIRTHHLGSTGLHPAAARAHHALDQLRRYHHTCASALPHLMESQFLRNQYGDYNAATSAAWGIDVRDPTADKRVFEFCAAIPPEQFVVGNQSRSLIRRAMEGRLPPATLSRTEKGTQAADWYESLSQILPQLRAELTNLEKSPTARTLLDLDLLHTALDHWPATAREAADGPALYQSTLPRALSVGQFIRRTECEG
jgi:asparagine synthase (glutamine-hydrolysing)